MAEPWHRSVPFRLALGAGSSAGPVLALVWPVFDRLTTGVWPISLVAMVLAMLTLGALVGLGAAFTVLLTLAMLLRLERGPCLRWQAPLRGVAVCVLLPGAFGLATGAVREGLQWPLWLTVALIGAVCGGLGALAVGRAR